MMSGRLTSGWLILLLATLPATGPVLAGPQHYPHLLAANNNGDTSLDEAVAQARRQHKGKVLSAETIRVDGRRVHHIKILTRDGRVKRTRIDAGSGKRNPRKH